jgi:hypothetical protein
MRLKEMAPPFTAARFGNLVLEGILEVTFKIGC